MYIATIALIPLTLFPRYGNVLGGTTVQVFGPCFDEFVDHTITCSFDETEVQPIQKLQSCCCLIGSLPQP